MLIHAEPRELVIENFRRFRIGKITVGNSPVRDCARHSMDQLPHGRLTPALVRISPIGDVAIEIFRDRDLCRERGPVFRNLDVFLPENNLAAVIVDLGGASLPFDLLEWRDRRVAKNAIETKRRIFLVRHATFARSARFSVFVQRRRSDSGFELNHGRSSAAIEDL